MKQFWTDLLAAFYVQREEDRLRFRKDDIAFLCLIAEDMHEEGGPIVREALTRDGLSVKGEGFGIEYGPYPKTWNRTELASKEYTDNDRREFWLKEQVARYE